MHKEILTPEQIDLLPLVSQFKREFYLVGGTAIALHIGHRRSIDFELFKHKRIVPTRIIHKIQEYNLPFNITRRVSEQLSLSIHDVKFTFFEFPFKIDATCSFEDIITMPDLLDLATMKAYALGRRSKWKDYVDLYFILKDHFSIDQITHRAHDLFDQLFVEKLFRAQLCYFDDINYSEPVEFIGREIPAEEIRELLIDRALDI